MEFMYTLLLLLLVVAIFLKKRNQKKPLITYIILINIFVWWFLFSIIFIYSIIAYKTLYELKYVSGAILLALVPSLILAIPTSFWSYHFYLGHKIKKDNSTTPKPKKDITTPCILPKSKSQEQRNGIIKKN